MARQPPGVRGPGGPTPDREGSSTPKGNGGQDSALHRISMPIMRTLTRLPRWLLLVLTGLFLLLGLIQTGDLLWLGVVFLSIVTIFFAWLLALSWPVVGVSGRILRLLVVAALVGITILKSQGQL
ncbi:MAG: DUF6703 family protein [Actinomycetes bacterium]